jgi:hypothetical protein
VRRLEIGEDRRHRARHRLEHLGERFGLVDAALDELEDEDPRGAQPERREDAFRGVAQGVGERQQLARELEHERVAGVGGWGDRHRPTIMYFTMVNDRVLDHIGSLV